jgi:hypothetical protein
MNDFINNSSYKNSMVGLLSLLGSVISFVGLFVGVALAGNFVLSGKGQYSPNVAMAGGVMLASLAVGVISIVLGCIGIASKNKRKKLSIIGISISIINFIMFGLLLFIGMKYGPRSSSFVNFGGSLLYEYHYKYIPPEDVDAYLEVEAFWKKVHLKAIADQKMIGWALCKIEPNDQQPLPYNFVTINVYDSMEGVDEGSGSSENFNEVYGPEFMRDQGRYLRQETIRINNVVHGEVWRLKNFSEQMVARRLGLPGDVKFTHFLSVPESKTEDFEKNGASNIFPFLQESVSNFTDGLKGFEYMGLHLWNPRKPKYNFLFHETFTADSNDSWNAGTLTTGSRAISPLIQSIGLDVRKEAWEVVDSTAVFPLLPSPNIDLSGNWIGKNYRCASQEDPFGEELMEQRIEIIQTHQRVVATKITGDDCVPAGNITWEGEVVDIVHQENKTVYGSHIFGTIYGSNPRGGEFHESQTIIRIVDENHLEMQGDEQDELLTFDRVAD